MLYLCPTSVPRARRALRNIPELALIALIVLNTKPLACVITPDMSNYPRSQDNYLRRGKPNQYRIRGQRGKWWVEGTDTNSVWVAAEPGQCYPTKRAALAACRLWRERDYPSPTHT